METPLPPIDSEPRTAPVAAPAATASSPSPQAEAGFPGRPGLGLRAFSMPVAVVLVVLAAWLGRTPEPEPRDLGALPDFSLTERGGSTVTRETLLGHPWIAGFVFTRCQGPCPLITSRMRRLQDELASTDVRLVSVTVDPAHDRPEVLARYADSVTADRTRWLFLTGETAAVTSLVRDGFHLGIERNPDASAPPSDFITHDTHFALVGPDGHIRGYFDSDDPARIASLVHDARSFAAAARRQASLAVSGRRSRLPLLNACLNATSALLLILGYAFVRRGRIAAHRTTMLAALAVSGAFLASYVLYHAQHGSTPFAGDGPARSIYFAILISHVVLAAALVPLVLATVAFALRGSFARHRALARWTYPIWMYVSVTGVAVYLLLYQIYV